MCKSENDLYKSGLKSNGEQRYICRDCNTKKCRKYRTSEIGKVSRYLSMTKYVKNNRDRCRAWLKCRFMEMKSCVVCGKFPAHKHHPDISKPLEVIFLCPLHHKKEDLLNRFSQ